jgi:hypothetical protein
MIKADFGFLPTPTSVTTTEVVIEIRPDFNDVVADCQKWDGVDGNWIYAPSQQVKTFDGVQELPYPSRVFGLPKTHTISCLHTDDPAHLQFHVWALSFFLGIRLTTTERGFLDATPIKPHSLIDFYASQQDLRKTVTLTQAFLLAHGHDPAHTKLFVAAVHAFFLAQCPRNLQFEQFIYLYTALDACYALATAIRAHVRRVPHSDRILWMCGLFGMTPPDWAQRPPKGAAEVATLRNATLHEALFMGEALGFAVHGVGSNRNLLLEKHWSLDCSSPSLEARLVAMSALP